MKYEEVCEKYSSDEVHHDEEQQLEKDYGSVVLITDFPKRSNPFWNMKHKENGYYNKINVIKM